MGITGETIAEEETLRTESDQYALRSHNLSNSAWEKGWLAEECVTKDELTKMKEFAWIHQWKVLLDLEPFSRMMDKYRW
ncbi:MAG: hypothetical protein Ct9H90mP14_3720 [Methanobacteriota archaeon]|nr:MAG: hypothetical protein Ct9H90mP14_3720 [Euryarchaeota archaeon]